MTRFEVGQDVRVRDAHGEWHDARTLSVIEGTHATVNGRMRKVHDFPVVWVDTGSDRGSNRIPWPVEDIRHVRPDCTCGCRTLGGDADDRQ